MCSWQTWTSNTGFMEWDLYTRVLDECEEAGVYRIVMANAQGEPLLHPKFFDMLDYAIQRGFWVMFSTNGTPLTPRRAERLARSGVDNIQFSFAGFDKPSYERIYVGGRFESVVQNLLDLVSALDRENAYTSLVVNGCYSEAVRDLAAPEEFRDRTIAFLHGIGVDAGLAEIVVQLPHNFAGEIDPGPAGAATEKSWYKKDQSRLPMCRVLQEAPGVFFDGRITACGCLDANGDLEIGHMDRGGILQARRGKAFGDLLGAFEAQDVSHLPLCKGCDLPYAQNGLSVAALQER